MNFTEKTKVALYIRVSTQEQANEGYSVGEQTERLHKYVDAMGWLTHKTYVDPGFSGGNTDRPGLKELIKDVERGVIDKVVVYKLDRLSRSQLDTLYLIEKVFLANNCDFVSMNENFDTSTPFGRAMIGILAVFAQLEREQIKERMSMGKAARAKEGKWGGSTPPVGYDYDPITEELTINEYEKMQILEAVDLFLKGTQIRSICRMFENKGYTFKNKNNKQSLWTPKNLRQIFSSKHYIGYIKYRGEWYKGQHDPILDEETFNTLSKIMEERREKFEELNIVPRKNTTYLGGMIYCKRCGAKYGKNSGRKNKNNEIPLYYSCYSRSHKVREMVKDPNCKNKNWRQKDLNLIVFDEIKKLATDPEYYNVIHEEKNKESDTPNKIAVLEKEIKTISEQISRFMDLYGIGAFDIEQVSEKIAPLNERKAKLEKELESLNVTSDKMTKEETIKVATEFSQILDRGVLDEIRLAISTLISYIEVDDEDVYIHWRFA